MSHCNNAKIRTKKGTVQYISNENERQDTRDKVHDTRKGDEVQEARDERQGTRDERRETREERRGQEIKDEHQGTWEER